MKVQYIYNEDGERESVIIPYKEWERIRSSINEEEDTEFDPDQYKGIYKGLQIDLEEEIKNLRTNGIDSILKEELTGRES